MPNARTVSPSPVSAAERSVFSVQKGLATRAQLLQQGVTEAQLRRALGVGRWLWVTPGLYALASWPSSPGRRLLAACMATHGVASHASAAWLWGLLGEAPSPPIVSVAHGRHGMRPGHVGRSRAPISAAPSALGVFVVYRSRDLPGAPASIRHGIPTTNPLRSLVDLAGTNDTATLDGAIDVALAKRLVSIDGLLAEAGRLKRPGRRGPAYLIARLEHRGFVGAPAPSVLESLTLRLLADAGINVVSCEKKVEGDRYRLDMELEDGLYLEVDGYAYHSSPEQKRYDDTRRNRLRHLGVDFLVYDWRAVREGGALVREVKEALERRKLGSDQARRPATRP